MLATIIFIFAMLVFAIAGVGWGIDSNRRSRLLRDEARRRKSPR